MKTHSKHSCQLHDYALQWLMRIGPKYPQEFKALMSQSADLRNKLETAIRNGQQTIHQNQKLKNELQNNAKTNSTQQQKPTIELKTNFNNFS